jgi:hypothetical protein
MKNVFIIAAALLIGNMQAQTKRAIGSYTKLSVAGSFDVTLNNKADGISIDAKDPAIIPHIVTEVTNGTLNIYLEKGYRPKKWGDVKIEVPYGTLTQVSLTGSGDITSAQAITSDDISISLNGSGDIALEVNARNAEARITGSGDLKVKGKTTNFKASVAGSGDLTANDFRSENTEVHVNGSGDASVHASSAVVARVAGSGDIRIAGNPGKEDSKVAGSGDISKI